MALKLKKNIIMTLLVIVNLIHVKSDDHIEERTIRKHVMDIPAQHLLRGAREELAEPNDDLAEDEQIETRDGENYERTTTEFDFKSTDASIEEYNTTELNQVTDTILSDGLNANLHEENTNEPSSSTTEGVNDLSTIVDMDNEMEDRIDDLKYRSLNDEPEMKNNRNDIEIIASSSEKLDTTTTLEPQRPAEELYRMSEAYDLGKSQRIPKTDQAPQNQPIDKRNDILKPMHAPPEISKTLTLRAWLEDAWLRTPAAILVPLRPAALTRALAVWNDLTMDDGLNVTDIILIGYDSNGISWRSRHNLQNGETKVVSDALAKLLVKYQGVHTNEAADATIRAIISSSKVVPYDSALFVFTDKGSSGSKKLSLALKALVEKRLKVYTIWTAPNYDAKDQQLMDLRKISQLTEGDMLHYSLQTMDNGAVITDDITEDLRHWNMKLPPRAGRLNSQFTNKYETLLVRRGGGDAGSHGIPVENGVTSLRVLIQGAVDHAVLYPPNGPQIDLLNNTSVRAFSSESRTISLSSPREVYLAFPGTTPEDTLAVLPMTKPEEEPEAPTVGLWHLSVRCDTCDYRLTVTAQAMITFSANLSDKDTIHLSVRGPVATVRESSIVDEYGEELGKLPFSYEPPAGQSITVTNGAEESDRPELKADVPLPSVRRSRIYVKIVGRDLRGGSFVRLAGPLNQSESRTSRSVRVVFPEAIDDLELAEEMNQRLSNPVIVPYPYNDTVILSNSRSTSQAINQRGQLLTSVQIGLSTRLYGAPGDNLQLYFEVTNFREHSVSFKFEATGELRFLRGINPSLAIVPSGQTVNVIVNVGITKTAQPGARDLITFTAYVSGLEQVSIPAYVYVVNPNTVVNDVWAPTLRHIFQGSCIGRLGDDCSQYAWSATVFARDQVGGLLRLSSSPIGLTYETNFISGTREEVTATYRSTCCTPRMVITAIDTNGNANSYVIDISAYLTDETIAAIALGILLLLALIALTAFLIYWCVKRRRESKELPYSTSARVSRRADIG